MLTPKKNIRRLLLPYKTSPNIQFRFLKKFRLKNWSSTQICEIKPSKEIKFRSKSDLTVHE